jgi:hypothetical protein
MVDIGLIPMYNKHIATRSSHAKVECVFEWKDD